MVMAPSVKLVLGSFSFVVFWVLAVFPSVPFLPIGRTAGSLLGAMLMVLFQVITPEQAYAAVDLPILGLLFGTMVVSIYLERADMFKYLGKLLSWKSKGPKDLLCRICVISAISSAFFTNDTCCVVLTEFVLKLARQQNIPPHPFLLALASSANIGSSATPIGNPQNLVIAVQSKISFGEFLFGIFPAMIIGMIVNALILLAMYWKLLYAHKDEEDVTSEIVCENDVISHRFSPAKMSHSQESASLKQWDFQNSHNLNNSQMSTNFRSRGIVSEISSIHSSPGINSNTEQIDGSPVDWKNSREDAQNTKLDLSRRNSVSADAQNTKLDLSRRNSVSAEEFGNFRSLSSKKSFSIMSADDEPDVPHKWKQYLWKACVYIVTLGMLASLLAGLNMSWTALMAALALVVLDFKDARPCLEKVSYSLLVFFCGMFITVDGFNKTGIPSALWDFVEPYAGIDHVRGIAILAVVILVLSNVASNVPTVLLLGARVAASAAAISPASEKKSWLILAWASTVAGNLSLLGSAANLIVCEQARSAQHYGYNLSFLSHLKFGLPSTILITAIGLVFIRG